jgi:uncharacterized protein (TIGR00106 family)
MVEFSMVPLDTGESLSAAVARSLDIIGHSGVSYRLNPMGTVLEGEYDAVMGVVKECFEAMQQISHRISMTLKMDFREGADSRMDAKIASLEKQLGRALNQ